MSERALKEVKTAGGVTVELVDYITGGEGRTLGLMADDKSIEGKGVVHGGRRVLCVKSVNGKDDNILQNVKDLRIQDYLEIIQNCTLLFGGLDDQKKTQ